MKLQIQSRVRIVTDQWQWIVQRSRFVDGKKRWDSLLFHKTLDGAVIGLANIELRTAEGGTETLRDFDGILPEDLDTLCQRLLDHDRIIIAAVKRTGLDRRSVQTTTIGINDQTRITSDHSQWILQHRRQVGGKGKWDSKTFHQTLKSAVLGMARAQVRRLDVTVPAISVEALCRIVDRLESEVVAALDNVRSGPEPTLSQKPRAPSSELLSAKPNDNMAKTHPFAPVDPAPPTYVSGRL